MLAMSVPDLPSAGRPNLPRAPPFSKDELETLHHPAMTCEEDPGNLCGRPPAYGGEALVESSLKFDAKGGDLETADSVSIRGPIYSVFSQRQKQYVVLMAALAGLFSTLSANIYFPALNTLAKDFRVSDELINLTVTSYMIFQALAPTIYGDLADMAGRRPAYCIGFTVYILANIGLALQNNYAALLVLRCLQSSGSSGTIALGAGMVADVATSAERGLYMGFVMSGPMLGPAIGPILGGILSHFLGWRSIFWFLTIMAAAYLIPFLAIVPETGRNIVGDGSIPPQGWNMSLFSYLELRKSTRTLNQKTISEEKKAVEGELSARRRLRCPNPLKTFHVLMEKDVAIVLFFNSIVYTSYYCVTSSLPSLFSEVYGFTDLQIGLAFIPYGAGCTAASFVCGKLMDFNYKRVAKAANITVDRKRGDDMRDFPLEKARIQVMWPFVFCGLIALVCYGWVLEIEAHFAVPLVLLFIIGLCLTSASNVTGTMCVDLYPLSPATATAANNLVRCLMGAAGTAVIIQLISAMGRGWCFTFVAAIVLFTSPLLWLELQWGLTWREERRAREWNKKHPGYSA